MNHTATGLWLGILCAFNRTLSPAQKAKLTFLCGSKEKGEAYAAFCRSMFFEKTRFHDKTG